MFYSNFKKKNNSKPQAKLSSKLRFQKACTDWEHKWKGCIEIWKYSEGYSSLCNVAYSCEQDNNLPLWSRSTIDISWKVEQNLTSVGDDWQITSLGFLMAVNSVSLSLMKVKTDSPTEVIWSYKLLSWGKAALMPECRKASLLKRNEFPSFSYSEFSLDRRLEKEKSSARFTWTLALKFNFSQIHVGSSFVHLHPSFPQSQAAFWVPKERKDLPLGTVMRWSTITISVC